VRELLQCLLERIARKAWVEQEDAKGTCEPAVLTWMLISCSSPGWIKGFNYVVAFGRLWVVTHVRRVTTGVGQTGSPWQWDQRREVRPSCKPPFT